MPKTFIFRRKERKSQPRPFMMEDWDKRSELTMAPQNRSGHRILDEQELSEKVQHLKSSPELGHRKAKPTK